MKGAAAESIDTEESTPIDIVVFKFSGGIDIAEVYNL